MKQYPKMHEILKRKNRVYRWGTIISLVVFVVALAVGLIIQNRSLPEGIPMNDAIINDAKDEWCYVDVVTMSDYFATYEEDNVVKDYYYFVWDNDYIYIAILDHNATEEELKDVYRYSMDFTDEVPEAVRIYGMTENISTDLKKIAIEQLNEWYEEEVVTLQNFDDICGSVLLNMKRDPNTISTMPFGIAGIGGLFVLIFGGVYLYFIIQTRKQVKKCGPMVMEEIESEIENEKAYAIDGVALYLTKSYVVDLCYRFQVIPYEDIYWLYLHRVRSYGATTNISIRAGQGNGKVKELATSSGKYQQQVEDLLIEIANRCREDILVGYTKENKKAFKAKVKENR